MDHRGLSRRLNPESEQLFISRAFLLLTVRVVMRLAVCRGQDLCELQAVTHHSALRIGCLASTLEQPLCLLRF